MKHAAILVIGLMAVAATSLGAQAPADLDGLVRRGNVYLDPATGDPYSGPVVRMFDSQRVRERGTMLNGTWDGERESFHLNGFVSLRETFRDGQLNGPAEAYFKSGQLSAKEMYRDGRLDGPYESYWSRGWVAEQGSWSGGEQCGEWVTFGRSLVFPMCPPPRD